MSTWEARRAEIDALLPELSSLFPSASLPVELLDQALLHATKQKNVTPVLKQLGALSFSLSDVLTLSTLSSSGQASRVQLAKTNAALSQQGRTRLCVVKTVERRWGFRMRHQQSLHTELDILKLASQSNPNDRLPCPELMAAFVSRDEVHILLSHAAGGDLWSILEARNALVEEEDEPLGLDERVVCRWMAESVAAISWLHSLGFAHRDIKPHNILLNARGNVLLTDFGTASPLLDDGLSSVPRGRALALAGTPDYLAPEILEHAELMAELSFDDAQEEEDDKLKRAYGKEVDWWSLGVVCYELLVGVAPFFAKSIPQTYWNIVNNDTTLKFASDCAISHHAKDFIRSLLVDAEFRPPASTIARHRWLSTQPLSRNFHSSTPPYVPPPFKMSAVAGSPFYSPVQSFSYSEIAQGALNTSTPDSDYSSFFASPGMSVLRPTPPRGPSEEDTFWRGMSWIPPADFFDRESEEEDEDEEGPPEAVYSPEGAAVPSSLDAFRARQRAFETPARQTASSSSSRQSSTGGGTPGSSGRARRMVSDVEAWKEMQEYAHSLGLSAKKTGMSPLGSRAGSRVVSGAGAPGAGSRLWEGGMSGRGAGGEERYDSPAESPVTDRLGRLQLRQRAVVDELDGLEEKYAALFSLAAKEA